MNYYRRYVGDYAKKTASLSLAEHGAYNLLLDECYSTERPLPGDLESLYRLCRAMTRVEQDAVRKVADKFFPVGADGLRRNPRAGEEIAVAQSTIEKQRESGVKSAAKRWSTDGSTHNSTDADAIQPPTSNHQPLASNHQEPAAKRAGRGARLPADWKPDAEQIDFCKAERPDLNPDTTAARFRDYWIAQPGARGTKLDWPATWRNWVRNEKRINGANSKQADLEARNAEAARRFAEGDHETR